MPLSAERASSTVEVVDPSSICPLCGSTTLSPKGTKSETIRTSGKLHLVQCDSCAFVFLKERPETFATDIYSYYSRREGLPMSELYDPLTTQRYIALLKKFAQRTHGRKLLDIGCGLGQFVHTAVREGWAAHGIDLSEPAVRICKNYNVPASCVDLFDEKLHPHSYDVVSMFELIEHISNPTVFLKRALSLVRPGGILYLTTPNFNALDRRVLGLQWEPINGEHLVYFTPQTLLKAVKKIEPRIRILSLKTSNVSALTIKTLLQPRSWPPQSNKEDIVTQSIEGPKIDAIHQEEKRFRARLETNPFLRWTKEACNSVLDTTQLGNAMTLLAQQPLSA